MSRVHEEHSITLERMVRDSHLIVVAKADTPPFQERERKIAKGPPYTWRIFRFRVVQTLKAREGAQSPPDGSALEVSGYDEESFELHRMYHEEGIRKSPFEYLYPTGVADFVKEAQGAGLVLFLREGDPEKGGAPYRFHNATGFESVTRTDEIRRLIAKPDPT